MSSTSPLQQIEQTQLYLDFCGRGFVPSFHPEEQAALFLSSLVNDSFTLRRLDFSTTACLLRDILLLALTECFEMSLVLRPGTVLVVVVKV